MGHRFKSEAIVIRDLPEMTIVFLDSDSIYMYPKKYKIGTIFQKWYAPLGYSTSSWQKFRKRMMYNKGLTLLKAYELAAVHDVVATGTIRKLNLEGGKVVYKK